MRQDGKGIKRREGEKKPHGFNANARWLHTTKQNFSLRGGGGSRRREKKAETHINSPEPNDTWQPASGRILNKTVKKATHPQPSAQTEKKNSKH